MVQKTTKIVKENKYFNAFNLIGGIGPVTFKKLLTHFSSIEKAWLSDPAELNRAGLDKTTVEKITRRRPKIDPDLEMEKVARENIEMISITDKNYPESLKEIYAPPALLYVRGRIKPEDRLALAVVGPRKFSFYGGKITPLITSRLIKSKLTIISGLAKGIDTLAHRTAIKLKGRTIAVLGSGLDRKSVYPFENRSLAEEISQNGAVVSEYPIGTKPFAWNFPQRNRIVSGLSLGVLVIEAGERSGALITAQNALEQNREVFAVPGSILEKNSVGTNNLIKTGAKLVDNIDDILEELNLTKI